MCPECDWHASCEGPWREYPELFGWDEFVPVKKAKPKAAAKAKAAVSEGKAP
jgi:hypothetical protein